MTKYSWLSRRASAYLLMAVSLLIFSVSHSSAQPAAAEGVLLAENGQAKMSVVISDQASPEFRAIAEELAGFLGQMAGTTFEVVVGDGASGIVLGTIEQFPDATLDEALRIRDSFDGREAYVIRTDSGRLRLLGATELGASHAAFVLLEELGCRWFFPGAHWEVIPSSPTLRVNLDRTDRPVLLSRRIWYGFGLFDKQARADYDAWSRHNRMAQSLTVRAGHAWQTIIAANQDLFKAHPEYMALVDGERKVDGHKFCPLNPQVQQIVIDWALNYFERRPNEDMVSVDPSDDLGHCECEQCLAMGKVSNRVFTLANIVAAEVLQKYPGKLVGLYAYSGHSEPPDFTLEPNVYVQLTAGFTRGQYTFEELLDLWPQKCRNMGFYEYFSVYLWDFDRLPGGRGGDINYLRERISDYIARKGTSISAESGNNWGPHGRGYYVANRLMWNPDVDVDTLLADFYDKAFGPAADVMQRYYERFDQWRVTPYLMSGSLLGEALRDIAKASKLASSRPDVLARLNDLKCYLRFVHLRWQFDHTKDVTEQKQLTLEILTHAYRTRYTYMNHWAAMWQYWTRRAADQFDEPTWSFRSKDPHPWADGTPVSQEEIDAWMEEALAYFKPVELIHVTFTGDLVPVRFPASNSVPLVQQYQSAPVFWFYIFENEPLEMTLTPGTIYQTPFSADARLTITDASGETAYEMTYLQDKQPRELSLNMPHPGLYQMEYVSRNAGWRIEIKHPGSIHLELTGQNPRHGGHMRPMYFYVPKGTQQVQYFFQGHSPHEVHGPDGKQIAEVHADGDWVTVPVPPGADGQVWSFDKLALGVMWFTNVPNYLATSPNSLMLPRDLVERDGLELATAAAYGDKQ